MEQEVINLNRGISHSPSFGEAGEMAELVNLIPSNGELTIIKPPRDLGIEMNDNEKLVYVHETYTFKHYIVVVNHLHETNTLAYFTEDEPTQRHTAFHAEALSKIKSVSSIGNTLIINTDNGLYYAIWRDGNYVSLGELPEVNISFGLKDWVIDGEESEELENGMSVEEISNAVFSAINKAIAERHDSGRFMFPFFVRYALRLFDGTLTHHSPPVLMLPSSKETVHVYVMDSTTSDKELFEIKITEATLDYRMVTDVDKDNWKDIIRSIDVFISAPIYQYDPSGVIKRYYTYGGNKEESYAIAATPGGFYQKQLIQHDLYDMHFALPELDKSATPRYIYYNPNDGEIGISGKYVESAEQANSFFDTINNNSQFYLLESIDLADLPNVGDAAVSIVPQPGYLSTITLKEVMTDDYRSHDKLYPSGTSVYNNRLNLSNVDRQLFGGFPTDVMLPYTNDGTDKLYFAAEITENGETFTLYNKCYNTHSYLGDYLYFPNPNAKKLYGILGEPNFEDGNLFTKISLNEHKYLNGAAFFSGFSGWLATTRLPIEPPQPSDTPIINEGNKIYTSEVGNPYLFPLGGINTIGTGNIIGISTVTKALSQGQFGQFPLYVFATDGIWAMEVNAEGLYGSIHAVSRDICNNATSITQIDSAIVFSTEQGLKMLQGSDVVLLSGKMEGMNVDESTYNIMPGYEGLFVPDTERFVEMLRTCKIVYDYPHSLLHIYPQSGTKHFVYSLVSDEYATYVGYEIQSSVLANPNTIIQINNGLYDYGYYQSTDKHKGIAITRPLAFGDPFAMKILCDLRSVKRMCPQGEVHIAIWGNNTMDEQGWVRVPSLRHHSFKYHRIVLFTDMCINDAISGVGVRYDNRRTNKMR